MIYLQASVPALVQRIIARGRDFEQKIDVGYLSDLNRLYDEWASGFSRSPVLVIPTEEIKYLEDPTHMERALTLIKEKLGGLPVPLLKK